MTALAFRANRPKVVRSGRPRVLYYPVRRAASSAIQNALGQDFIDWRYCEGVQYDSFYRFTCYRNTYDRLRSLYYCFVNPAPLGRVDFLGSKFHEREGATPSFDLWIRLVCETTDADCDEHLHSQDWHLLVDNLKVYHMHETPRIEHDIRHEIPFFARSFKHHHRDLDFSDENVDLVLNRYVNEITTFGYNPWKPESVDDKWW